MDRQRRQRGFTLIAAMVVVVVATFMVVGAITFTGAERLSAVRQSRSERLSGCVQAARNLFFSQMRVLQGNVMTATVDAGIAYDGDQMLIQTRHYGNVALTHIRKLGDSAVGGAGDQVYDISNVAGKPKLLAGYYAVSAVCRERSTAPTNSAVPEQEVEFVIRVGL